MPSKRAKKSLNKSIKRSAYPKRNHTGIINNPNSPMYGCNIGVRNEIKVGPNKKEPLRIKYLKRGSKTNITSTSDED